MVKEFLPEFNRGWGTGIVHGENKDIIDRIFETGRFLDSVLTFQYGNKFF